MCVYYLCIIEVSVLSYSDTLLRRRNSITLYCLYIYFTHSSSNCFALYARTCSFMLEEERKHALKKKGWEKRKANEINKGYRDVRSLSYRTYGYVFSLLLVIFHFTCIFEGYRFVAKCLSRADLAMFFFYDCG